MRFSKEKLWEIRERIRLELVKNPYVSIYQLQDILLPEYGRKLDKNFLAKIKRKIHKERAVRLNYITINEELAKLQDLIRYGRQQLVDIVFNEEGKHKPSDIISSFRAVIWGEVTLFDAMLNSGVFNRPKAIEKEKPLSPEEQATLNRALNFMYSSTCDKCADFHDKESHEKNKHIENGIEFVSFDKENSDERNNIH